MRTSAPLLAGVIAVLPAFACSSASTPSTGPAQMQNTGMQAPTQPTGHDTNPYGVAYPSQNIGYGARKGNVPGNQIKNYKFLGYPGGDVSKGLQTVALADYYDPEGKTAVPGTSPAVTGIKLIHLGVAAVWCVPCNEETDATVPLITQFAQQGVVFAQALDDGPVVGTGATTGDLQNWILKHKSNFTEMLDPNNANLGQFFDAAAIPWNAFIDPRSMEILEAGTGYSGDLNGDVMTALALVAGPPSYTATP